jgi:hypothetical protein
VSVSHFMKIHAARWWSAGAFAKITRLLPKSVELLDFEPAGSGAMPTWNVWPFGMACSM